MISLFDFFILIGAGGWNIYTFYRKRRDKSLLLCGLLLILLSLSIGPFSIKLSFAIGIANALGSFFLFMKFHTEEKDHTLSLCGIILMISSLFLFLRS